MYFFAMRWTKTVTVQTLIVIMFCATGFANQKVYLVHGYGSAPVFMRSIEHYLNRNRFETINFGYPSMTKDLTICGESLYVDIKRRKIDTVSFVTHSMGALVVRSILNKIEADSGFPKINKLVMIAPPNHGAAIADFFASNTVLRYILY